MKHTNFTEINMEKETKDQIIALRQMQSYYIRKKMMLRRELVENYKQIEKIGDELRFLETGNA